MEEKTYEELLDLHKEITAKLEVLAEEDLENPDEIQEQINELQKRYLDLCKRKDDKEQETKELFEKLDTLNPLLAEKRRTLMQKQEEADDRNRKIEDRKRKMEGLDPATLEKNSEDDENLVGQLIHILHAKYTNTYIINIT